MTSGRHGRCRAPLRHEISLDRRFDQLVPRELRHLSEAHWTPVDVAVRAAALLSPSRGTRILDVGAGIGKLCSIGALSTYGTWVGVEHHETLVAAARDVASALGVDRRTAFIQADALEIEWREFDAFYLYNPFESPLFDDRGADRRGDDLISRVQQKLAMQAAGTRVVTLHGFGGVMPSTYELLYHERVTAFDLDLALWAQRACRVTEGVPA